MFRTNISQYTSNIQNIYLCFYLWFDILPDSSNYVTSLNVTDWKLLDVNIDTLSQPRHLQTLQNILELRNMVQN